MIHVGDCIEVMRGMEADSVDAVVTDPPAGVSFMSKTWDHDKGGRTEWVAWMTEVMRECYRVLKPGGYAVVWSLPRTCHWTAWAMEDAGFIIRDQLAHIFASGFPKGKAQLKPAREDWWLARKPGPLRPLGIDECRIGTTDDLNGGAYAKNGTARDDGYGMQRTGGAGEYVQPTGRWPSNVLLSDPALFDEPNPEVVGSGATASYNEATEWRSDGDGVGQRVSYHNGVGARSAGDVRGAYGDTGGYSRFFLVPKSSRADREPVVRGQLEPEFRSTMQGHRKPVTEQNGTAPRNGAVRVNQHPTVKSLDLMRHLIRLVTPSGGTVLDPFLGSGSTAIAAELEGFPWIGIEKEPEYVAIAEARLNGTQRGLGLDTPLAQPVRKLDPRVIASKGPSRPEGASASTWFTTGHVDKEPVA